MRVKTLRVSAALAIVAALTAIAVVAADSMIEQRQHAMEKIGDSMKSLGAIAKGKAPFDAEVVRSNAETIAGNLEEAAGLFPEGSAQGEAETWAKAEVWSDPEDFGKRLETAVAAAKAMQSVTEEAGFLPALGELGDACKGCHDTYRRPKH